MIICDTHCDTLYSMVIRPGEPLDVTMERLQKGGVSLQTLAMYVGKGRQGDVEGLFAAMFRKMEELEAAGWRRVDDPSEAIDGQVSVMLSIEGCEPFDPGLHVIEEYRRRGVRMAAVTWNFENTLAYPAASGDTRGLKPYGLEAVRLMQKIGMAVDVSHLNDAGVWDILEKCDLPPMASHSNCRALVEHRRNLSDDPREHRPRDRPYRAHVRRGRRGQGGLRLRFRRHRAQAGGPEQPRRFPRAAGRPAPPRLQRERRGKRGGKGAAGILPENRGLKKIKNTK